MDILEVEPVDMAGAVDILEVVSAFDNSWVLGVYCYCMNCIQRTVVCSYSYHSKMHIVFGLE